MLREAGFVDIERANFLLNGNELIVGRKRK